MIVSKNMLIPEVQVAELYNLGGVSFQAMRALLAHIDKVPTCYIVLALVRKRGHWYIEYGKVA